MRINKNIDFKKEAIDFLFKVYSKNDPDLEIYDQLIKLGVNEEAVFKNIDLILKNYNKLKENFKKEVELPKHLIPYFTLKIKDRVILNRLYCKWINSKNEDYKIFLNRFMEVDIALKDDYSDSLSLNDLLKLINELDTDSDSKLTLLNFYNGGESLFLEIMDEVKKAALIIVKYYYFVEEEVEEIYNELLIKDTLPNIFIEYFDDNYKFKEDTEVVISIVEYSEVLYNISSDNHTIYVGFLTLKALKFIKENNRKEEDALNVIKSITDQTRYNILKILAKESTYGNNIANILELSAPTINHHLNILVNNRLIKLNIASDDNKKIYYEFNKKRLAEVLEILRESLL